MSDPIQESLLKLIAEKKKALKPQKKKSRKSDPEPASNVINIMDALRKSIADDLEARKAG